MPAKKIVECYFLIPLNRDKVISDGERHPPLVWQWLNDAVYTTFEGLTIAPGVYKGIWKSPKTGQAVRDSTRKFIIALPPKDVEKLRSFLRQACRVFEQECIYLNVGGYVEYVEPEDD